MEILSESSKFWSSCLRFRYHLQRVPVSWQLHSWNMGYPWLVSGVVPKQGGPGNWGILSPRWVMKKLRQWGGLTWFDTSWLISNMLFCALEYPGMMIHVLLLSHKIPWISWNYDPCFILIPEVPMDGDVLFVLEDGFPSQNLDFSHLWKMAKMDCAWLCGWIPAWIDVSEDVWRCLKMSEDVWRCLKMSEVLAPVVDARSYIYIYIYIFIYIFIYKYGLKMVH